MATSSAARMRVLGAAGGKCTQRRARARRVDTLANVVRESAPALRAFLHRRMRELDARPDAAASAALVAAVALVDHVADLARQRDELRARLDAIESGRSARAADDELDALQRVWRLDAERAERQRAHLRADIARAERSARRG